MLEIILALLAGLLLLSDRIGSGSALGGIVSRLRPFRTVVGVVALVVGLLNLFGVLGLLLFLGGWALAADALGAVPAIGGQLRRWGRTLRRIGWLIGLLLLVVAVLALVGGLGAPRRGGPPWLR